MKRIKFTDELFLKIVKESLSYSQVIRKLGLVPAGGNFDTIKRRIKRLNIDISHMTGKGWNTGKRYRQIVSPIPIEDILVENSTYVNACKLKNRLFKEGFKEYKCERCGRKTWMGKPIPLELHHINGIKCDQRLENLLILCPNCHAFTENYRGKNSIAYKEIYSLYNEGTETIHEESKLQLAA